MDTQYRKNLKAVLTASKDYTDNSIDKLKWELGTYDLSVTTDSTVAYTKTIPTNAIKGRLNYIGGASKVSENLIVLQDVPETTINGITYSVSNGIITLNGTATTGFSIYFDLVSKPLLNGDYYWEDFYTTYFQNAWWYLITDNSTSIKSDNIGRGSTTINTNSTTLSKYKLYISEGVIFNNVILKPMLVKGTTAPTEFSEGFENIRSAKTTSVKFEGANLAYLNETTASNFDIADIEEGKTYTLTCDFSASVGINLRYNENGNLTNFATFYNKTNLEYTFTSTKTCKLRINLFTGGISTSNIMLNYGSTALAYVPYIAPITKAIPSEIINNEYYGIGYDDTNYNKLDLINRKITGNCDLRTLLLSSIQNAIYSSSNNLLIVNNDETLTNYRNAKVSDINFEVRTSSNWTDDNKFSIAVKTDANYSSRRYDIRIPNATSKQDYIDYFTTYPNLSILIVTPITFVNVDVSQYIDDDFKNIDTTNMGTITFENEFEYDVPSEIDYLIEEVKS